MYSNNKTDGYITIKYSFSECQWKQLFFFPLREKNWLEYNLYGRHCLYNRLQSLFILQLRPKAAGFWMDQIKFAYEYVMHGFKIQVKLI